MDTSNVGTFTSSTSLATLNFSSIALQESGIAVLNNDEIDASSELLAIMDDETGTGLLVFGTAPTFASTMTVGTAGGTTGAINMKGTTSGIVTVTTAAAAGRWTFTWPTGAGTDGYFLKTDGNGVSSWAAATASTTLDAITAAAGTATIANANNAIVWNWGTLTTQTGMTFGGGTAMTTGSIFKIGTGTYIHTTAETGSMASINFTDASTNTSGNSITNGLNVASTINTSGAGTKAINGITIATPTKTACTTGACTWTGLAVADPGTLTNTTFYAATFAGGNVGIGTATPGGTLSVLSANATGATTSSGLNLSVNSLTTGTGLYAASSSLTSGKLVDLQVSGTAAAASQTALNILTAGANATDTITTYGAQISNTHTNATAGTNVDLYLNASGATTANYGLLVNAGNVGIGTTTPGGTLSVVSGNTTGTTTSSSINLTADSLTTGTGMDISSTSI